MSKRLNNTRKLKGIAKQLAASPLTTRNTKRTNAVELIVTRHRWIFQDAIVVDLSREYLGSKSSQSQRGKLLWVLHLTALSLLGRPLSSPREHINSKLCVGHTGDKNKWCHAQYCVDCYYNTRVYTLILLPKINLFSCVWGELATVVEHKLNHHAQRFELCTKGCTFSLLLWFTSVLIHFWPHSFELMRNICFQLRKN